MNAYETIRREVVERIERDRLDPRVHLESVDRTVVEVVEAYQRRAHLGEVRSLHDPRAMARRILASVADYGPLSELFSRSDVEEVFIEGPQVTYLDAAGRLQGLPVPTTEEENRQVIDRLLATTQRRLDTTSPIVQARVLDGSARLTAAIPPVADRLSATIRRHILRKETLATLVERDSLSLPAAGFLWAAMQSATSTIVSGPPGAGKTSMLAALIAAIPSNHCVRICEEIRELNVPITHGGYYEARPPALDGSGEVSLRQLIKFLLAMRPDHLVVGEVRGGEAFELTRAVNAGCGFSCTVHANSGRDALDAIVNAALMAGENVTEPVVRSVLSSAVDFVIHLDRDDVNVVGSHTGLRRQVTEVVAVAPSLHRGFTTEPIFARGELGKPLVWTGVLPPDVERLERALPDGLTLLSILEGRRSPL